ncbi:hypothetical protein EMIT0P265_20419 [Pseudomonas zeae]
MCYLNSDCRVRESFLFLPGWALEVIGIWVSCKQKQNQEPLTLALSRRERGLTEVFGRSAPMCDTESNARFKTNRNRLPLPRERAGVRGSHLTKPKPCARF